MKQQIIEKEENLLLGKNCPVVGIDLEYNYRLKTLLQQAFQNQKIAAI